MRLLLWGPRLFGIRTGVSLGREDFAHFAGQPRGSAGAGAVFDPDHGFIYVIKGDQGLVKIGITTNPTARLAQLRSSVSFPIDYAWIGAPKEQTVAIEREAHEMLDKYRKNGEWFAVSPDAAVGAIHAAAFRLGQPVLDLDPGQAEKIRQIGYQLATTTKSKPSTALGRVAVGVLQLLAGFVLAIAFVAFFAIRFARIF